MEVQVARGKLAAKNWAEFIVIFQPIHFTPSKLTHFTLIDTGFFGFLFYLVKPRYALIDIYFGPGNCIPAVLAVLFQRWPVSKK